MPSPFGDQRALGSDESETAVERLARRQVGLVRDGEAGERKPPTQSTSPNNAKKPAKRTSGSSRSTQSTSASPKTAPKAVSKTVSKTETPTPTPTSPTSKATRTKSKAKTSGATPGGHRNGNADQAARKDRTRNEDRGPNDADLELDEAQPVREAPIGRTRAAVARQTVAPQVIQPPPIPSPTSDRVSAADSGLSIADYRDAIWRRRYVFAAIMAGAIAAAIAFHQTRTPTFLATTRVVLQATTAEQTIDRAFVNPAYAGRALSNEIKLAESAPVTDQAGEALDSAIEREVTPDLDADVLNFTVRTTGADDAAVAANRWAAAYLATKQQTSVDSIADATQVLRNQLARIRADRQQLLADQGLDALIDDLAQETDADEIDALQRRADQAQLAIEPELAALDAERTAVATAISELNISGQLAGVGTARVLETAIAPEQAVGIGLTQLLVMSAIAGSLMGLGAVIVLERSDQRILTQRDAKRASGLPVLGAVARPVGMDKSVPPEQAARLFPGSGMAEAYHGLGQSVRFAALGGDVQTLLVTSSGPGEGKTTSAVNLAWVLSSSGLDVVLVDLDLRKPRVHHVYDEILTSGFVEFADGSASLGEVARTPDPRRPNLRIIPAGNAPADVASFLHTDEARDALARLAETADLLVIDSPPALPVSDASILASSVDAVLVVARAGQTSGEDLSQCVANIQLAGGRILGTVLTGISANRGAYGNVPYGTAPAAKSRFVPSRSNETDTG